MGDGIVNLRVGAIIEKDGKVLMVGNDDVDYYYSVGGRIQFGESAEDAVRREVLEETGCALEIDRLGFIHEDFFLGRFPTKRGKLVYEIGFYYYMKMPPAFEPVCRSLYEDGAASGWNGCRPTRKAPVSRVFPHGAGHPVPYIRHIVTDDRETETERRFCPMARPLVAIVGRPNVGKSMLFNRLVGQRLSIVEDTPGVTRDRLYAECEWCGRKFDMVDTGGIEPTTDSEILLFMREQAQIAIDAATVIVLVTDLRTGVTAADKDVANMLLRSKKPVVLAVNKADSTGATDPASMSSIPSAWATRSPSPPCTATAPAICWTSA